jgi:hypothetical protein
MPFCADRPLTSGHTSVLADMGPAGDESAATTSVASTYVRAPARFPVAAG